MSKLRKLNLIFFLLSLILLSFSVTLIFVSLKNNKFDDPYIWNKIPERTTLTYYFNEKYTYPFYFTIHSNFFALIYFLLMCTKKISPSKSKNSFIFETIILFNLILTILFYWIILWPFSRYKNYYAFFENIILHVFIPGMFFIAWIYRILILKQKRMFIAYKEFYKFLIYPFLYLFIAIILYYVARTNYVYKTNYYFSNKNLVNQFVEKLKNYNDINFFVKEKMVTIHYYGKWGNAVYYFLNFDNLLWWIPILFIFGILLFFLILIFSFIKINKTFIKKN